MEILHKVFGRQAGTVYEDGVVLFREGEKPIHIYSVLSGQVDLFTRKGNKVFSVTAGSFVGISFLFGSHHREFTAITKGQTRLLDLDKKLMTERIYHDPSLAYRIMSIRYREIVERLTQMTDQIS
ncbi:MAG: cyclic nucleotide-binding domain-containing protein [Magnetococcales bacterium]|nr:cyclic nucleotide-binding domain-containing protein [Magnetococcales bacterium]